MTVPEDVSNYITINRPNAYCDDCIQAALDLSRRQQVQQITSSLGLSADYDRNDGICSTCGSEKKVIRHA